MRYQVKTPMQPPYGGMFKIERKDLGMVGFGTTFEMLERNVRKYRRDNAIPIGLGFSEELETQICLMYPNECEATSDVLPLTRRIGLDDVVRGTRVLLELKLKMGGQLVPSEEANRRAHICDKCKLAQEFPVPCSGICGELKNLTDQIVGGYPTFLDGDKRACKICRCFLASHVRVPYAALEVGLDAEMKAQFAEAATHLGCWKVPGAV